MINSGPCNGLSNEEAKKKVVEILGQHGCVHRAIQYKLRDWLFSRQRYLGRFYGSSVLDQLELRLPSDTSESPLANARECLCRLKDWCYFTTTR